MPFRNNGLCDDEFFGTEGKSATLRRVLSMVKIVAPTDAAVLMNGETGTGKELIAQAVHKCSDRSTGLFIKVNCAAIPATLLESALFGHERGAFTGSLTRRMGRFELANRDTLFLDEIWRDTAGVAVEIAACLSGAGVRASGRDAVSSGQCPRHCSDESRLESLCCQWNIPVRPFLSADVFPIQVPALRERRHDIHFLLEYFITRYAHRMRKRIRSVNKKTSTSFKRMTGQATFASCKTCWSGPSS
jgi:formate hydrogenlyase transcriptional activator